MDVPPGSAETPISSAPLLILGIPAVFVLCCVSNLGDAWMGNRAKPVHLAVGAVYVLFWAVFTYFARHSRGMLRLCQLVSLLWLSVSTYLVQKQK